MEVATLIDLVLGVLVFEAFALAWICQRRPRWPRFTALLPNLGAGLCLVLAVRGVAQGSSTLAIATLLALAGLCHVADLVNRLKR